MRLLFTISILLLSSVSSRGQDTDQFAEEIKLRAAGFPTDGKGLLAFFKARTTLGMESGQLEKLTAALADREEATRRKAYGELLGLGSIAVPALRAVVNDPDSSAANGLARRALEAIQGEQSNQYLQLAARLLVRQNPAGTTEALLGFLPFTDHEETVEELKRCLHEVAFGAEGKPDAALLKALTDEQPVRRAAAAEVLGQRGGEPRDALMKLLNDPKASVRLRAALALGQGREPKAITALITALPDLMPNLARDAEEFLMNLAGEQAPKVNVSGDAAARQKAREAWEEWWKKSEGNTLLDEFKKRTMTEARREQAEALIKKLADDNFKVRQAAEEDLQKLGVVVVPLLRKVVQGNAEPEMKDRARNCLAQIEKVAPGSLSPVYARLVAFRKPAGAVEVLLDYLPFIDEEVVASEVQAALNVLAGQGGKNVEALLAALKDKLPVRRSAAAEALALGASAKEREEVRKLIKDTEPGVQVKTLLALVNAYDRDAVPLLIEQFTTAPAESLSAMEDLLSRMAGDDALPGQAAADEATRQKRREGWTNWWKERGSKGQLAVMLARNVQDRPLGYTLIISPNNAKIMEIGGDGKARWEIAGLSNVWDAQFVARNRILILESGAQRLTERTLRGDVLWEMRYQNIYPTGMQRLHNNNILLTSSNRIQEMTRGGKEVFAFTRPNGDILHARKMKDGTIIFVTSSSTAHRIDATGKEIKTWRLNSPSNQGCEILPNGNIIYPQQWANRVFEYDQNGQQVWTGTAMQPTSVARMPNGNTLVGSNNPYQLVELDRTGKEVWKVTVPIQPLRILRR